MAFLLLQNGDKLLLQSGDKLLLEANENAAISPNNYEQCDISGFRVLPGCLIRNWNGLMTRLRSVDPQHPQELGRSHIDRQRGSRRPEQPDRFLSDNEITGDDL